MAITQVTLPLCSRLQAPMPRLRCRSAIPRSSTSEGAGSRANKWEIRPGRSWETCAQLAEKVPMFCSALVNVCSFYKLQSASRCALSYPCAAHALLAGTTSEIKSGSRRTAEYCTWHADLRQERLTLPAVFPMH